MTPRRLYRTLAIAEVITWTLLLLGMVLKYVTHTTELGVRIGGGIHGFVFLSYCVATVLVGVSQKWPLGRIVLGLISAVVPYATVPFERSAEKRGELDGDWRLGRGHTEPVGFPEKVADWVIRRPVPAAIVAVVGIAVVFSILLYLGPPIPTS